MSEKKEVCVCAVAGMLGSAFDEKSFYCALEQNPAMIGCDSGTSDSGPFFPGAGVPRMSRKAAKRDLELMIQEGVKRKIPVLIGSAGTAGANPNVDWMIDIVKEIAAEKKIHFKLAEVKTEMTKEQLKRYMDSGKLHALEGAPAFEEKDLEGLSRVVSVVGAEPFIQAMENGADVVICGRCTDTSIYASVPIMHGLNNGFAWHAGKVLECGTLAAVRTKVNGAMLAWVREDSVSIEPAHPDVQVSPVSIVSHTLYENSNPFDLPEPGLMMHTQNSVYTAENDRRVKITETTLEKRPYTIKLEGVKFEGYRRVVIMSVYDPLILKQFEKWLADTEKYAVMKVAQSLHLEVDRDFRIRHITYGNPHDPNTEYVGLMFDVISKNEGDADGIISTVWHTALHVPIAEWEGAQSQTAFPFSPPTLMTMNGGATYSFCLNHIIDVDDPMETCKITYYDL